MSPMNTYYCTRSLLGRYLEVPAGSLSLGLGSECSPKSCGGYPVTYEPPVWSRISVCHISHRSTCRSSTGRICGGGGEAARADVLGGRADGLCIDSARATALLDRLLYVRFPCAALRRPRVLGTVMAGLSFASIEQLTVMVCVQLLPLSSFMWPLVRPSGSFQSCRAVRKRWAALREPAARTKLFASPVW